MEVVLAATGAAAVSAYVAAVKDGTSKHPVELMKQISQTGLRMLQELGGTSAPRPPLPSSVSSSDDAIDASRRGLRDDELLLVARYILDAQHGTRLRKLNLSHTPLSEAVVGVLSEGLRANGELSTLRLRDCSLGDANAAALCGALSVPPPPQPPEAPLVGVGRPPPPPPRALSELAIASNRLGPAAGGAIAAAVRALPSLVQLDLSFNPLGGEACVTVCEALTRAGCVRVLGLACASIDDGAAWRLALALRGVPLLELDLEGNDASDRALEGVLQMAPDSLQVFGR